jgi:hypothetical protein
MNSENRLDLLPSEGRGRRFESFRVRQLSQALSDKIEPAQTGQNRTKPVYRVTVLARIGRRVAGLFLAALAFDPHVLLLSWSAERQERVPATSAATCRAAVDAIAAGRWLADDPPAAMRCERGSAFAPGSDCIAGFNCERRR